ncbi:probable disease resistance protein At1g61300 isoform X1 [Hordeum vulgare subsp. vulgare]|uniref:AAA+ ATPase domain-containing protein n=1 Tax=Hordeum vulgare subsp. vulgare TaxID=112509 RepID=A0A8I7BHX3_HORVV|nr:probable disease resistance protein At1g61300 isoform X1 [Hordeum vulgare subsp. vulgare]
MAIEAPALGPLLANTVNTVITPFYTLFSTNATYCFTAHTNVRNHRTETETLKGNLLRVKQRIVDSEMNGLIPTDEAEEWVPRAEQAISEEAANRESFVQRCRIFGCSLNCWGNYKTSKKAAEKVDAVRKYISSTPLPENVTRTPPPPRVVDLSTHPAQLLPSRERTLQHALGCIKEEDAVRVIGIWGPRGVGKTHLLTKINNSFLEHCPFDIVVLIKASRECTVQKVQAQIINRFGITQNVNVTAQIHELLKKRNFLVLVDDLCEKMDLSAAGIPHPLGVVDQKKRKVLIISPSQSICDLMGVDKYIQVLGLEEEEAHQLFEQSFGEENLYTDPHVGVLAKDLVRELIGRPSELIHFGKMMRRSRNARQWEDVIDALKTSNLRKDNPLCMAERIVGSLEGSTKDLIARKNDVCQKIKNAEREGKKSTNEVDRWLEKVAEIIDSVHVISVDSKLKKDVTMEGSEKLREVQECLSSCPGSVAIESMPPPVQEMPGPSMSAENRNLKDALQYIKDDPKVGMIGIWGPGGVGKTHLLKNINNSFGDGMTFDFVLFVTASRGCSVEKVQSQIIERLKLPNTGPKSRNIYEYMKTKSFLVLLDDLWDGIDLQDAGIPYPLGNVNRLNRKVVLTTRLREVCGQMKVKKELKVAYLQEHEAWHLFEENIGAETLSSPHIEALARELMKELKGLPLALITIGKAMYQKDVYQWETAIQYMKQSCCADDKDPIELGMETNVFTQLKFSYDNLRNKTLRDCFLTCALWPEDENIRKVDLAQCWMGLGLVNGPDIESSFRKSYSLIAELTAACLLEGSDVRPGSSLENSYGSVKAHDVIRDMALWISCDCGEKNDKWIVAAPGGRDKKVIILSNKAECISLSFNRIPIRFNIDPLKLRILCLRNNELDESIIVEAIKNFKSLTYLDLSGNNLKRIPEELCSLVNLEYLDLSENQFGETQEVPYSFGKLINLKFLYLTSGSGYVSIPAGVISSLKALQVIDLRSLLRKCSLFLFRELGTLTQLKALGILVRDLAQIESLLGEEAANLPVRYLALNDVCVLTRILSTDFAQRTLYELDINEERYFLEQDINEEGIDTREITIEHVTGTGQPNNRFGALNNLRLTMTRSLRDIKWMGATPAFIFPRLTYLELFMCQHLLHLSWVMYLPRLEQLHIVSCDGMVQPFMRCHGDKLCDGSAEDKTKTFPRLKLLFLIYNESLESIGDKGMEFPSLERLELEGSLALKRLPFQPDSLPPKLKELRFDDARCWERLECQEGVKTILQPYIKFGRRYQG